MNFVFKGLTESTSSKKDPCPICPLLRTERKKRDLNSQCRHFCLQLSAGVAYLLSKLHKTLQFFKSGREFPFAFVGWGGVPLPHYFRTSALLPRYCFFRVTLSQRADSQGRPL